MEIELLLLGCGAFVAGFVDAVVGGGGLIQVPLLLAVFPAAPIAVLFGTNKLSSVAGTLTATLHYGRRIRIPKSIAVPAALAALPGAALGAATVSFLPPGTVRPLVLGLLIIVGTYTWLRPDFGRFQGHGLVLGSVKTASALTGFGLGFYDGFFGPGTGSFLVFAFVRLFGLDMVHASASAKLVNLATNVSALAFFLLHQGVMWKVGLVMAGANVCGAYLGSHMTLKHGSGFVRWMLLAIVSVLVVKLSWDLLR
ncbi:TSUP family transporter [Uliginosibacterium sp. H3]|uniref:Probable membrane transporter protein n=1 Tax=Uliginosibacterium silvisoli TaxID=3114758 RepID=A0ABU6K0E0_9RHOO|nr:TSUP family transporter [Uliginosibacterium sp. H3]